MYKKILLSNVFIFNLFFSQMNAESFNSIERCSAEGVQIIDIEDSVKDKFSGLLNEESAKLLIEAAYKAGYLSLENGSGFPNPAFLRFRNIIELKGNATLSLFAIDVMPASIGVSSAQTPTMEFILKETLRVEAEPKKLMLIKNSPINELSNDCITRKLKKKGFPTLALHDSLLGYFDNQGTLHVFILLQKAKGKQIKHIQNRVFLMKKNYGNHSICYKKALAEMGSAYYNVGYAFGKMHYRYLSPAGDVKGKTYTHQDPNNSNIFINGSEVTLIDNSSIATSIEKKKVPWINVANLLRHIFRLAISKSNSALTKEEINNYFLYPLLKGYIKAYPASKRKTVIKELRNFLLTDSPTLGTTKLHTMLHGYMPFLRQEYISPAFDLLSTR